MGSYIGGWVTVESIEGEKPTFLHQGTYKIDDPSDENKLVRELHALSPETRAMGSWVWKELVRLFFAAVYQKEREGIAFTRIGRLDAVGDDLDLVQDLIQRGDPTILFGSGKATKGVIATAICVSLALGHPFASLNTTRSVPMYLDWEDNALRLNARLQAIARGLGIHDKSEYPEIEYKRCDKPLADMLPQVMRQRDKTKADFLVVDSLDPASGYQGNWNERAGRLFDAIRVLDMTTLIIAHSNKQSLVAKCDQKQDMSVFGSIMNTNRARAVWRVMKEQEPESSEALVTLYQESVNHGKIKKPLQLEISWRYAGEIRIQQHWPYDKIPI
jgi:AAA domain